MVNSMNSNEFGGLVTETDDPIAALSDKKIAVRSAGARDLSLHGERSHIPLLLEKSRSDRSPAVRLLSCTAAADILSRHRVGSKAESMSTEEREEVLVHLNRLDPGINTAMFSVLACLDLPVTMQRLSVGMRDPRGHVRLGAAVGMWRHVMSRSQMGNESLEKSVTDLISDERLPADSLAELARICAAGGYRSAIPALSSLDLGGVQAELVDACIEVLEGMTEPGLGAWWSDGRDAGEVSALPALPPAGLLMTEQGALMASDGGWVWRPKAGMNWRCMYLRRVGQAEPDFVLQGLDRTWFRQIGVWTWLTLWTSRNGCSTGLVEGKGWSSTCQKIALMGGGFCRSAGTWNRR